MCTPACPPSVMEPFVSSYLSYLPAVSGPLAFDLLLDPVLIAVASHWWSISRHWGRDELSWLVSSVQAYTVRKRKNKDEQRGKKQMCYPQDPQMLPARAWNPIRASRSEPRAYCQPGSRGISPFLSLSLSLSRPLSVPLPLPLSPLFLLDYPWCFPFCVLCVCVHACVWFLASVSIGDYDIVSEQTAGPL